MMQPLAILRPEKLLNDLLKSSKNCSKTVLDADANRIVITVERGGFDLIRIEDDGSGIDAEDLPLALDRHATSKLKKREDLNSIHTLGFRGEALASIGMVSATEHCKPPIGNRRANGLLWMTASKAQSNHSECQMEQESMSNTCFKTRLHALHSKGVLRLKMLVLWMSLSLMQWRTKAWPSDW
jgi:hypothetical protein